MTTIDPSLAAPPLAGARPREANALGKDAFLKLLVAQLKYQDPLNPADGSEFMAQTAQFTMVEKLEELGRQTGELLASQRALSASSLIGRRVTYLRGDGGEAAGVVSAVRLAADGPILQVGADDVPLGAVRQVGTTPAS
ncbi:MAG: flagellar hook capping protein [Actinomycetota bacterium]|nr:flagellar hook capping protein [Actinomycetota bacterium]